MGQSCQGERGEKEGGERAPFFLRILRKNGLGLPSLAYAPCALPGWVGGLVGSWMAYDMSLHLHCTRLNDDSRSWLTRQHTHAPKKALPERTGCRVTNLAIRMSEHSIIKFHVCSKQVQKDSSAR